MDSESKLWYFENFNLLDSLSMKEKMMLSDRSSMNTIPKGSSVYFAGDTSSFIYFLKKGRVKISKYSEDGKEMIMAVLKAGEIFGELALLDNSESRDEFAEVIEDAIICSITIPDLQDMLEKNPVFNLEVTKLIGLRLKKVRSRLENLVFHDAETRIRNFISDMADEHGRTLASGNEILIRLNLTHQDISKLTATSRQKVTTVLNEFEKQGLIHYDRKEILIRKPQAFA